MTDTIIETQGLWHTYPGGLNALIDITLSVNKGDYIGLTGQNGSGKTTLVKHFNGLLRPTRGKVIVAGHDTRDTSSDKLAAIVGYIFQNPDHMLFSTTIENEVAFGPRNLRLSKDEIKARVDSALAVTSLSDHRHESPLFFGKGIRRMITIASILAMRPEVLVIDEPTTGMDHRGKIAVMGLIDKLHKNGHTIIIITHDMRIVANHTQRTLVMHEGRILLDLPTREIFSHEETLRKAALKPTQRFQLAKQISGRYPNGETTIEDVASMIRTQLSQGS